MNNFETWNCKSVSFESKDEWLAARKSFIGASEVSSVFGAGYKGSSPLTVWRSKTTDYVEDFDDATIKLMKRGSRMEPVVAEEFSDETGLTCIDPGEFTVFYHPEIEWLATTLDRVCTHDQHGPIPVELKVISGRFRHDWDPEIEPPLKYVTQCQTQMAVTGASHCYLVGLVGGDDLVIHLLERSQPFIDVMTQRLGEFWEHVKSNTMPPVDDSEATSKMLGKYWPHDSGDEVDLPDDSGDWDEQLIQAKADMKDAERRKTAAANKIKAAIGDAAIGVLPDGSTYSWKTQQKKECVVRACEFRVLRRKK